MLLRLSFVSYGLFTASIMLLCLTLCFSLFQVIIFDDQFKKHDPLCLTAHHDHPKVGYLKDQICFFRGLINQNISAF